jgi:hypothetical protein
MSQGVQGATPHVTTSSVAEMLSNPGAFGIAAQSSVEVETPKQEAQPAMAEMSEEGTTRPEESEQQAAAAEKPSEAPNPNVDYIMVTDEKGRRKIEIDFSDKEKLKKLASLAYGSNKWKVERDNLAKEVEKLKGEVPKVNELQENWNVLESTYKKEGVEGLIDLLEGKRGAYKSHLDRALEKQRFLERASPEEIKLLQQQEASERLARELDEERKANMEFRKKFEAEKEQAEIAALSGVVNPTFEKYRFAGKLGNAQDEQLFDEVLWTQMQKQLAPYEEQGVPLTRELVDSTLRNISTTLRKRMAAQTEKKVSKVIEQKKREAAESAQSAVKAAYKPQSETQKEAMDHIKGGDLKALFSNWNKYKGNI